MTQWGKMIIAFFSVLKIDLVKLINVGERGPTTKPTNKILPSCGELE